MPGPGEQAQTFETIEAIEARPEWNAMRPRLSQPQTEATGFLSSAVILQGTATGVRVRRLAAPSADERQRPAHGRARPH